MTSKLILVINCGSSSIKFALIEPIEGITKLSGIVENLFTNNSKLTYRLISKEKQIQHIGNVNHSDGMKGILNVIQELSLTDSINGIGHRVVHGGETYSTPTLINTEVLAKIKDLSDLAPLHNPANIAGIEAAMLAFPNLNQVAIFDTAFHHTIPKRAFLYGLPYDLYKTQGIRRYGFHGSSHYFISQQTPAIIGKPFNDYQIVSAHLGNGCSVAAIKNGKSVDTSMGMTPLEGLIMGTRSGDIDPGLVFHLVDHLNYSLGRVNKLYNKESGLLGLSGLSNDCRTLESAMTKGNAQAKLALDVFCYRIARYIASLTVSLERLDAVVFTGGIGENSPYVRKSVISNLSVFNLSIDEKLNEGIQRGKSGVISNNTQNKVVVIPTNEEWVIAQKTIKLLEG